MEKSNSLNKEDEVGPTDPPPRQSHGINNGGGGWGGWGFSPRSVFSDIQKAAAVAADGFSRNAASVARSAAMSIADVQNVIEDSEASNEGRNVTDSSPMEGAGMDDNDMKRISVLDKLEKASEDSLFGQGLKAIDNSVETFTSGAWKAIGSAWKEGYDLVNKLESSAANLADSIQHGGLPAAAGSVGPSLLESGKAFTAKGLQVLELVGKETMDLLIAETGIEVEKNNLSEAKQKSDDDQLYEEINFDRCFYIYGGPEHLEELEALSNHHALLYNRRKAKLSAEQKSVYAGKLRQVQQILNLNAEDEGFLEIEKGKKIEIQADESDYEMRTLYDSSVKKAAELAVGFTNTLAGLATNEVIQRTAVRLEALHSEGVHRLSEMCCFAVLHILTIGKSIISKANEMHGEKQDENVVKFDWPEDAVEKAKRVRVKAQSITVSLGGISRSFITGISEVADAFQAAILKDDSLSSEAEMPRRIHEKAKSLSESILSDRNTAMAKIQDGLHFLSSVVLSTS